MKNFIIQKCNNLMITCCDWISNFFGTTMNMDATDNSRNAATSPQIYLDEKLSKAITSMLSGTKVDVYVYASKIPRTFTFIGKNKTAKPLALRYSLLSSVLQSNSFMNNLGSGVCSFLDRVVELMGMGEMVWNASADNTTDNMKVLEDPNITTNINNATGQAIIDAKEISCYISTSYIEILDDDEIIAVLLHEVGHNAQILKQIILRLAAGGGVLSLIIWCFIKISMLINSAATKALDAENNFLNSPEYLEAEKTKNSNDISDRSISGEEWFNRHKEAREKLWNYKTKDIPNLKQAAATEELSTNGLKILNTFIIIIIIMCIIISYFRRKMDIASDTFTVQLGYGPQLESALRKSYAHTHDFGGQSDKISGWNIGDTILRLITAFFNKIYNLLSMMRITQNQDRSTRLNDIHQKTEEYNDINQVKYQI